MNAMQLAVQNLLTQPRPTIEEGYKHCRRCCKDRPKSEFRVKSDGNLLHTCMVCLPGKPRSRKSTWKKQEYKKVCPACGKAFKTTNSTKKSCSTLCAAKIHSQQARDRARVKAEAPKVEYQKIVKERIEARATC